MSETLYLGGKQTQLRHRQTDRQTDRYRDRERDKQRDRDREREISTGHFGNVMSL